MRLGYLTDANNAERHRLKQQAEDAKKKIRRDKLKNPKKAKKPDGK